MKPIKLPVKEKRASEKGKIGLATTKGFPAVADVKIAVDNDLAGLVGYLEEVGFNHAREIPDFKGYPEKPLEDHGDLRFKNHMGKDQAIHAWLTENAYEVFLTPRDMDINFSCGRDYSIIKIHHDIMKDYGKLATKIKIMFDNASHPRVQLFAPYAIRRISRSSTMSFPKVKRSKGGRKGKKKFLRKLRRGRL